MKDFKNKVIVITGAGSGIGQELAFQLAEKGARLALIDFNPDTLEETQKQIVDGKSYQLDVSNKEAVFKVADQILEEFGQVDVLINNAGVALGRVPVEDIKLEDFEWVVNINLWGVIYGTKAFLKHLKVRPEAYVINLSSVFGLVGINGQSPYCVTKFGVRGFSQALRFELRDTNVKVMNVHPGGIKTRIAHNSKNPDLTEKEKKEQADKFVEKARTTVASAANQIIKTMQKGKERLLIGPDARLIDRVTRLYPTKAVKMINNKLLKLIDG